MPPPYSFSTHIGDTCAKQFISFQDLADKLKMDVHDLMQQCNAHAPPTRALVKGFAKELKIDESFLQNLADEVRRDLEGGPLPHDDKASAAILYERRNQAISVHL